MIIIRIEYNTLEGIKECMSSYEKFTDMIRERTRAGYKRGERLQIYYVMGRYMLDSCGNVGVACKDFIPAEKIKDFPPVVDQADFQLLLEKWNKENIPNVLTRREIDAPDFDFSKNKRPFPESVTFSMRDTIPHARIRCPHCGKGWNLTNCHDVHIDHAFCKRAEENIYIGKTVEDLNKEYRTRSDKIYCFREDMCNVSRIDNTPHERIDDMVKNEHGCFTAEKDYVIVEGDEVLYDTWTYYHKDCVREMAEIECKEFLAKDGEGYCMGNHAGRDECDVYIKLELQLAGIDIVEKSGKGEVPYNFEGQLGKFSFRRAWTYWVVNGPVPLDMANEMFQTEEGKKYVRVQGDCGCPSPEEWAKERAVARKIKWSNYPNKFVDCYHIDTWKGLKLFADTVREIAFT